MTKSGRTLEFEYGVLRRRLREAFTGPESY